MEEIVERSWTPVDDEQLDREIEAARAQSKIVSDREPRAASAPYNRRTRRIEVELVDGCLFAFPAKSAQGLEGATPDQLAEVEVLGNGYALRWEKLDADFTVAGLLAAGWGCGLRCASMRLIGCQ
jgi:hypothetical protein